MRLATLGTAAIMAVWTAPALADHGHAAAVPHVAPPHITATTPGRAPHAGPSHPTTNPPSTPHAGGRGTAHHDKDEGHGGARGAGTRGTGHEARTIAASPVAAKIASHPQLASRVRALLPAGTSLNEAARGFRNQGQFLAALHVSRNLGVPFAAVKRDMVTRHRTLGQTIHDLRPSANARLESERAEHDARSDATVHSATTATTATTTATTTAPHDAARR